MIKPIEPGNHVPESMQRKVIPILDWLDVLDHDHGPAVRDPAGEIKQGDCKVVKPRRHLNIWDDRLNPF